MILRRVPTSMLVALGLLPLDACKCPLGPCLDTAIEEPEVAPRLSEPARPPERPVDDTAAHPCLTAIAPDDGSVPPPNPDPPKDEPPATPTGPELTPCLSVPPPAPPKGKGGGQASPPADEPFASADVVTRVLERGALPADVIARLRGRA